MPHVEINLDRPVLGVCIKVYLRNCLIVNVLMLKCAGEGNRQ